MNLIKIQLSDGQCSIPYCITASWRCLQDFLKHNPQEKILELDLSHWSLYYFECFFRCITYSKTDEYRFLSHREKLKLLLILRDIFDYVNPENLDFEFIADGLDSQLQLPHPLYPGLTKNPYSKYEDYGWIYFYEKANILDCLERYEKNA